jgi:hypothetical protein
VQANRRPTRKQITVQYNSGVQNGTSEAHNMSVLVTDGLLQQTTRTGFHAYQLKTSRSGSSGHAITNTGQLRSEKTLPGPTNPGSCCVIRKAKLEFGISPILPGVNGPGWERWCNCVYTMFSWHTLGPLIPTEQCLNATAYLNIVADQVHPLMVTIDPLSHGYFQQDNAPCHKACIVSKWSQEHDHGVFSLLEWPVQSPDLNPIEYLCGETERAVRSMNVTQSNLQQLRDAITSIWTNIPVERFRHLVESVAQIILEANNPGGKGGTDPVLDGCTY